MGFNSAFKGLRRRCGIVEKGSIIASTRKLDEHFSVRHGQALPPSINFQLAPHFGTVLVMENRSGSVRAVLPLPLSCK